MEMIKIVKIFEKSDKIELCYRCQGVGHSFEYLDMNPYDRTKVICSTCAGSGRLVKAKIECEVYLGIDEIVKYFI